MIPINKPTIVRKDLEYVLNCMVTEKLEEGALTKEFEAKIASIIETKYSVAVNSFTSALHLSLLALDIKNGDEVIIPAYADTSILNALNYVSAKPVLADIEMNSYNIAPESIKDKITAKTKAIIVNHNFGIPAAMDDIIKFNIPIIENCSYSFGAEYHSETLGANKKVGSFGVVSLFSFDTDTIITTGNGGMVLSNSKEIINRIKSLKYNPDKKDMEYRLNFDYRFADISAALGLSQIKLMKQFIERRRELAEFYNNKFLKSRYKIHKEITNRKNVYSKYTIMLEGNVDKVIDFCQRRKIKVKKPIEFPVYKALNADPNQFPHSEHLFRKLLQIPLYPSLKKKEIEEIATTILKVI